MNKQSLAVFLVVSALCLGTGGWLRHVQSGHRLGKPGLALTEQPLVDSKGAVVAKTIVALPDRVLDYTPEPLAITDLEIRLLPKDTTFGRRRYVAPDKFSVDLSAILMGTDRTSIHKPEFCLDGQGWKIEKTELQTVRMSKPVDYDLPIMTLTALKPVKLADGRIIQLRGIYSYWFVCENRLTARHGERMWWLARDLLLTGTLPRWAYVSCFVICYPGQEAVSLQRMDRFIAAAVPKFQLPGPALSRAVAHPAPAAIVAAAP